MSCENQIIKQDRLLNIKEPAENFNLEENDGNSTPVNKRKKKKIFFFFNFCNFF